MGVDIEGGCVWGSRYRGRVCVGSGCRSMCGGVSVGSVWDECV